MKALPPIDEDRPHLEEAGDETSRLTLENRELRRQLAEAQSGSLSERAHRLAALNLMEDAVAARKAEQVENEVRRGVEAELRVVNARQTMLLKLADRLRDLADEREIMRSAVTMLGEHLQLPRLRYVVVDPHSRIAEIGAAYTYGKVDLALEGAPWSIEQDGAPDDGATGALHTSLTWRHVKDGRVVAALVATADDARAWPSTTRMLLEEFAERTWAALELARAIHALRESNAHRAELLAAARAAAAQAQEASRIKDEFLGTLSHEMRTPLTAIALWAGALRSGSLPAGELDRALDAILESASSQSRLIEDLLDLSRLNAGKFLLVPAPMDVAAATRAAIEVIRPSADAKSIELHVDIDDSLGAALIDSARWKQVLWNLLSNATKFTPPRGRVALRMRRLGRDLEVEVSDSGEGIAPSFLPYVFDRFRQADMGETRAHAGLGIGLALSRQIVELQGGTIEAQSEGLGKGACFRVRVPFRTAEGSEPPGPRGPKESGVRPRGAGIPARGLKGLVVILVEDDTGTRDAMTWTLERAGARVAAAKNGAHALASIDALSLEDQRRSVVVCDLGLPVMSGYELVELIAERARQHGWTPPPALAVSAHARETDRTRALATGFDLYLSKPVTPSQLIDAVQDLRDIAIGHAS